MAGRKREKYKIEAKISVSFMLELEYESKIIKKILVIKEICSWLQTFRPSNPGGTCVLAHVFYNYSLAFNLIFAVLEHWLTQH